MGFWIFVILIVVGIVVALLNDKFTYYSDILKYVGGGIAVGSGIIALIMTFFIGCAHIEAPGNVASNQKRYDALIYKAETEQIRDEFGIVNKEYIDEIQDWNEDLARYKAQQRDFWVGIFVPNKFDQFEFIDLDNIKMKT